MGDNFQIREVRPLFKRLFSRNYNYRKHNPTAHDVKFGFHFLLTDKWKGLKFIPIPTYIYTIYEILLLKIKGKKKGKPPRSVVKWRSRVDTKKLMYVCHTKIQ